MHESLIINYINMYIKQVIEIPQGVILKRLSRNQYREIQNLFLYIYLQISTVIPGTPTAINMQLLVYL